MRTVKIQIKTDEVSKDSKLHLKFKKKLRMVLMQRDKNKFITYVIDDCLNGFAGSAPLLDWKFGPVCGCDIEGMEEFSFNVKYNYFCMMSDLITAASMIYRLGSSRQEDPNRYGTRCGRFQRCYLQNETACKKTRVLRAMKGGRRRGGVVFQS